MRAKGSKEGKGATKGHERQTDGDKKKEVLWCLVYIPQPSCLKYSKICNLYNHPVQMSANNPLSQKQDRSPCRWCHQLPIETDGASLGQFRTKQILQITCWSQWHTGSWIAPQEMTKGKIKHLHGLQRGGQLDGEKNLPGADLSQNEKQVLERGAWGASHKHFSSFPFNKDAYSNHASIYWEGCQILGTERTSGFLNFQFHNIVCLLTSSLHILRRLFMSKKHLKPAFHFICF